MHLWLNKSIIKSSKKYNIKQILANRPKGISDEEWKVIVADSKFNKLVVLNQVPRESRKKVASNERSEKD